MKALETGLALAALAQMTIAALNLQLVRLLGWRPHLGRLPLLIREVFYVHSWFISITVAIFAVLTMRFRTELASEPIGRWLAGAIGIFWGIRTVMQVTYYSGTHWRGNGPRTLAHAVLLGTYAGFTALYLLTAFAVFGGK